MSGARGPGARRWGGRRGGGGGAGGPPRARAMRKKRPARASTRRAVNAARAVATGAAAAPAAGASMPPRWAAGGGSAGRARAREGLGMGRHLGGPQKVSRSLGFPPAERGGGVVRSGGKQGANILGQGARGELEENAMRARAGRWAAHRRGGVDADTRSLSFQRRRNQEVPPPYRHGESDPEPCRPLGRQGGPANGRTRAAISRKSHLGSRRKRREWWKERGCAGCAQKCGAKVGGIAGGMRSPGLTPASARWTVELTRPAHCT